MSHESSGSFTRPKPWTASQKNNAPLAWAMRGDLGERLDHTDLVIDQHRRDQPVPSVTPRCDEIEIDEAVGADRQDLDLMTLPGRPLAGVEDAGVFGRKGDDRALRVCFAFIAQLAPRSRPW